MRNSNAQPAEHRTEAEALGDRRHDAGTLPNAWSTGSKLATSRTCLMPSDRSSTQVLLLAQRTTQAQVALGCRPSSQRSGSTLHPDELAASPHGQHHPSPCAATRADAPLTGETPGVSRGELKSPHTCAPPWPHQVTGSHKLPMRDQPLPHVSHDDAQTQSASVRLERTVARRAPNRGRCLAIAECAA